jgi:hypothetical protein
VFVGVRIDTSIACAIFAGMPTLPIGSFADSIWDSSDSSDQSDRKDWSENKRIRIRLAQDTLASRRPARLFWFAPGEGHELGSKTPNWGYPSAQWVARVRPTFDVSRSEPPKRGEIVKPRA